MDISAALPTFVITLREGTEATLVIGIVLAYLSKAGRSDLNRWVYGGIVAGMAASVAVGLLLNRALLALAASEQPYAAVLKQLLEVSFGIIAIGLLSWMLIWMTQQAKHLKADIQDSVGRAVAQSRGWSIFSLIAITVLREGFETVIFISAQFQAGGLPVAGAIAGLLGAAVIGVLLFQFGVRINLQRFFQVLGLLLLLVVAGLIISTLRHVDAAAAAIAQLSPRFADLCSGSGACILGPQVWDTSAILPDRQFPGILLRAFFGYTQKLYLTQAVGYVAFLAIVGGRYLQTLWPSAAQTKAEGR
ncbi:MAG: FTR1 family protein [Cyanobacteria bacterium P01_A01_bin.135]